MHLGVVNLAGPPPPHEVFPMTSRRWNGAPAESFPKLHPPSTTSRPLPRTPTQHWYDHVDAAYELWSCDGSDELGVASGK